MRIAFLSDIHANREAFEAALSAAQAADRIVILGDIVGYGADPRWCVDKTMELAAAGAIVVRGNHDQASTDLSRRMSDMAQVAIEWTRGQLSDAHKDFLTRLPLEVREDDRLYVHADGAAPAQWHYVLDATCALSHFSGCADRVTICGHVHRPALYCLGGNDKVTAFTPRPACAVPLLSQRRWLAVMGAVGQPRDGDPSAAFGLLDTQSRALTFERTPYDIEAAAAKIRAAGLPDTLAARLFKGR